MPSLRERLAGLAKFLPLFEEPDFSLGEWVQPKEEPEPGVIVLPYFNLSEAGTAFVEAAYDLGWVQLDFDWVEWMLTSEAIRLRDDHFFGALAIASFLALADNALRRTCMTKYNLA